NEWTLHQLILKFLLQSDNPVHPEQSPIQYLLHKYPILFPAIDLAKLANSVEAAYICEILKEDGTMARMKDLTRLSEEWQLP
ncbi:3,4-dihydroxy-2-butanone-4-phosphate synthase, partial [Enterococcus hirae]|uniref:3,4-dihydroxy-2-butanone-4-phosphate synthase n=1 Tax=Enterococcus hirae TaxID=1354 RepID=UPI003D7F4A42